MFFILDCSISHFGLSFASQNSTVKLHLVMVSRLNTYLMAISGPGLLDPSCPIEEINIKRCRIVVCIFLSKKRIEVMKKQKLFQCDICDKRFGHKLYMKVHKRTHYTV